MRQRSRTEYSLINIFANLGGFVLNTLLGFVCRIVFVRTLATDYLGISGLFSNILTMLSLAELGIGSAIAFALYKPIAEENHAKIASLVRFYAKAYRLIGICVAVVGVAIMPFLDVIIRNPPEIKENLYFLYILYLFNTVFSYFYSYKSTLLTAMQRNYIVVGYNYIITIIQSALQCVYLLIAREFIGYLLIQVVGCVAYNIWISKKTSKDYPYIDEKEVLPLSKAERRELLVNVKALTINKISGVLVNSTDNIAITFFNGLSSVGIASNYVLFSTILDSLITKTFNALTGSIGNLNASSDENGRYAFFKILNLANFWLYGWAAFGIAFVSGDLVRLFYGTKYVMPLSIPIILAINFYCVGMLHAFYTYKSTLGLFRYGQYILIFTGFINLALDVLLGQIWGVLGIYVATFLARLCTNLWYEPYAVYKYGLHQKPLIYFMRYLKYAAILVVGGIVCWLLCELCAFSIIVNVVVKCIICTVIPNGIFYLCFRRTDEFKYLLESTKQILGKLKKGRSNAES